MKRLVGAIVCVFLCAFACWAATLESGQDRTAEGVVSAVDIAHRAIVIEVPTPKGDLTVGVTLEEGVTPRGRGGPVALGDVQIGEKARLKYARRNGRLVGLDLELKR